MDKALILFFRDDLASLQHPALAARQASIATVDFINWLNGGLSGGLDARQKAKAWYKAAVAGQHQQTVLRGVLTSPIENHAQQLESNGIPSGLIRDRNYAIRDGQHVHHVDLITGVWAFMDLEDGMLKGNASIVPFPKEDK